MPYYRIRLEFKSPVGTPLISGTLWGHLAWAIRYIEGEEAFERWLQDQRERPWIVSSAMPMGFLPRPLLRPKDGTGHPTDLSTLETAKKTKKMFYIRERDFLALAGALNAQRVEDCLTGYLGTDETPAVKSFRQARNRIDRRTSRTPEVGGLFFLDDVAYEPKSAPLQFFIHSEIDEMDRLDKLISFIGQNGYGRKSSIGRGIFKPEIELEEELFQGIGERAMSLSHGVLTDNMMDCRYRIHPHFGKLGGHLAVGKFGPFKYPILMMSPGATFTPANQGPFGRIIEGVHHDPALAAIRHHALHLTIYFTEASP